MNTVEALKAAKEIIATPEKWCREYYAMDATGACISALSEEAVCFCALGALQRVCIVDLDKCNDYGALYADTASVLYRAIKNSIKKFCDVASFNDTATHADVIAMFDRAIAAEEAKAA